MEEGKQILSIDFARKLLFSWWWCLRAVVSFCPFASKRTSFDRLCFVFRIQRLFIRTNRAQQIKRRLFILSMQNRRFQGEETQIDRIKSVQIAITATSVFSGRKMLKVSYLSNELTILCKHFGFSNINGWK